MNILLTIVLVVSVVLIAAILLQQGKGADDASAFGAGGKNTGALTSFSMGAKIIAVLVVLFFVMIFTVHLSSKDKSDAFIDRLEQRASEQVPVMPDAADDNAQTTPAAIETPAEEEETLRIPQ